MYPPHYIDTHVRNLMKLGVACTFSLWSFIPDKRHSRLGLWLYECLRDLHLSIQAIKRPELCVRGMTFGFNTELGRLFGFRTDIRRGEDGSLALAMKPYGRLIFITSRKARALTSNSTIDADGSLAEFRGPSAQGLKRRHGAALQKQPIKIKTLTYYEQHNYHGSKSFSGSPSSSYSIPTGYGILLYMLVKLKELFVKPVRRQLPGQERLPDVTLFITAFNEEEVVDEKMRNCLGLDYPADKLHIVWTTDGSNDSTNQRLEDWPQATVHFQPLRQGKTAAMTRA